MENRHKYRLSLIFQAPFGSCRSRNVSDIVEKAIFFLPQNQKNIHTKKQSRSLPSISRTCSSNMTKNILSSTNIAQPRHEISSSYSPLTNSPTCPQVSPISALNSFYDLPEKQAKNKEKKKQTSSNSIADSNSEEYFSFESSSSLFSSDSSKYSTSRHGSSRWEVSRDEWKMRDKSIVSEVGLLELQGKVKNSIILVKKSSDPYEDFRTSMVEMIVEKQIFCARDLEQLLNCYISLNSYCYHRVILEVFTEILEVMSSD